MSSFSVTQGNRAVCVGGKGMTEDETVGWHHRVNGHQSEQTLGCSDGQGSLACCGPWGRRESDTTEQLNHSMWWEGGKEREGTEHHGSEPWESHSEDSTMGSALWRTSLAQGSELLFRGEKPSPESGLLGPGGWRCFQVSLSPSQLSPPVASAFPPSYLCTPQRESSGGSLTLLFPTTAKERLLRSFHQSAWRLRR